LSWQPLFKSCRVSPLLRSLCQLTDASEFSSAYFVDKTLKIRSDIKLSATHSSTPMLVHLCSVISSLFWKVPYAPWLSPASGAPLQHPIRVSLLYAIIDSICPVIYRCYKFLIGESLAPNAVTSAIAKPILKKSGTDPETLSNYRPVSLPSVLSKMLEIVVSQQLLLHIVSLSPTSIWIPTPALH